MELSCYPNKHADQQKELLPKNKNFITDETKRVKCYLKSMVK